MPDISELPTTIGTATVLDQLVAYNESAIEKERIIGIPFSDDAETMLNGQGQFDNITARLKKFCNI